MSKQKGRPKTPGREAAVAELFERMHEGESVRSIAKRLGLRRGTLVKWATETPGLADQYTRAREAQADAHAEKLLEIADGTDEQTEEAHDALEQLEDELAKSDVPNHRSIIAKYESQIVQRDRLRVDALKWTASKLGPKRYGDKVELQHGGSIETRRSVALFDPNEVSDAELTAIAAAAGASRRVALFLPSNGRDTEFEKRLPRVGLAPQSDEPLTPTNGGEHETQ